MEAGSKDDAEVGIKVEVINEWLSAVSWGLVQS